MTVLSGETHRGLLFKAAVDLFFLLLELVAELLLGPLLFLLQETQFPQLLAPGEEEADKKDWNVMAEEKEKEKKDNYV